MQADVGAEVRGQILGEQMQRRGWAALTSYTTPPSREQKETKPWQANQPSINVSLCVLPITATAVCTLLVDHSAGHLTCFPILTEMPSEVPPRAEPRVWLHGLYTERLQGAAFPQTSFCMMPSVCMQHSAPTQRTALYCQPRTLSALSEQANKHKTECGA